jgi:hypothetical protein
LSVIRTGLTVRMKGWTVRRTGLSVSRTPHKKITLVFRKLIGPCGGIPFRQCCGFKSFLSFKI